MNQRLAVCLSVLIAVFGISTLLSGCADEGASCADKSVELAALCAPGCDWELMQEDSAECGLNGIFNPFGGGSAGGRCEASGSCGFICSVNTDLCPHGVSSITRDAYTCAQEGGCTVEGAIQCNNGMVSVCSGGTWADPEACPDPSEVCDLADDMTLGCVPGEVFELPKPPAPASSDGVVDNEEGEVNLGPGQAPSISDCEGDCGEDPCQVMDEESCQCVTMPDCG